MIVTSHERPASQFSVTVLHNPFLPWVRETVARFLSHARWICPRVCLFGQRLFSCHPFVSAPWESRDARFSFSPSSVGIDQKYISPRYDSAECFLFRGKKGRRNGIESSGAFFFFFSYTLREDAQKGWYTCSGERGFRLPAKKKPGRPN